jgi:hypothetical protein
VASSRQRDFSVLQIQRTPELREDPELVWAKLAPLSCNDAIMMIRDIMVIAAHFMEKSLLPQTKPQIHFNRRWTQIKTARSR